jgi:hypothetical protein
MIIDDYYCSIFCPKKVKIDIRIYLYYRIEHKKKMTAIVLYKHYNANNELVYTWKHYHNRNADGSSTPTTYGEIITHQDPRQVDSISPANLTFNEKMVWLNQQDDDVYIKHHKRFMCYKYRPCIELRKIISEWNNKRTINKIKGVSKMRLNELITIAEGGKFQ